MNITPLSRCRLPHFADIKPLCRGRWAEILHALIGSAIEPALMRRPRHAPCPKYGGKDGFHLYRDFDDTGGGYSNGELRGFADGFDLIAWSLGITELEALNHVAAHLGLTDPVDHRLRVEERPLALNLPGVSRRPRFDPAQLRKLWSLWHEASPLYDPVASTARRYLHQRGLCVADADLPGCVRCHPGLTYWLPAVGTENQARDLGSFPALLAQVRTGDGRLVTLQRTYLTSAGRKASVPQPRKLMPTSAPGLANGAAIRIDSPGPILHVTEGLETALAVREVVGPPVWALLSAAFMPCFDVPAAVEQLIIWADKDRPNRFGHRTGERAAHLLADRTRAAGCAVTVFVPPFPIPDDRKSLDWLDVLNTRGPAGFPIVRLRPAHCLHRAQRDRA